MVRDIPEEKLKDPNTTYLDNSCGDGNFLVALLQVLTKEYGHDRDHVVDNQLYGVDIMEDNVEVTKSRLCVSDDHPHFVCHDSLTYDYSFK
jgi:type I restriction-modification system DNA methylase subunit